TLDGGAGSPGTILFGARSNSTVQANNGTLLTLGPNLTVTGASGSINSQSVAFDNQGKIIADPAALGLGLTAGTITLTGTGWTNHGTIAAQNGGTILAQGTISNFSAGTLTDGNWRVFANSTLRLINGNITTNAANIVLDGANSNFFSD